MQCWVAVYDIPDDRRRDRVAQVLDDFGSRVQKSVFEIMVTEAELEILRERIQRVIHPEEDAVRLYAQCAACAKKVLDWGIPQGKAFDIPEVIIV